jgi:hypothetical protein
MAVLGHWLQIKVFQRLSRAGVAPHVTVNRPWSASHGPVLPCMTERSTAHATHSTVDCRATPLVQRIPVFKQSEG